MTLRWVFGLVPTTSLVVPLLDRRGDPPLVVVEQDVRTLTIGAICSLAAVDSRFFFTAGFLIDTEYSMVDLELNDDDLDVLREIEESNRGEQHSQPEIDSSSLTVHSRLESRSIC
jgi:hypothetical protein